LGVVSEETAYVLSHALQSTSNTEHENLPPIGQAISLLISAESEVTASMSGRMSFASWHNLAYIILLK